MLSPTLSSAAYARALTLRERGRLLQAMSHSAGTAAASTPLPASVRRRETRWRERCASASPARFAQRLAADDLTVDDVPRLLDSTGVWMSDAPTTRHSWCELAPTETMHAGDTRQDHDAHQDGPASSPFQGFLALAWPQLREAQTQLSQRLDRIPDLASICGSTQHFVQLATPALANTFAERVARVLVLELNVMRLRDQLTGTTAEERFHDFVRKLGTPQVREALFDEYPVLLRTLRQAADQWVRHWFEVAERLVADHSAIEQIVLHGGPLGLLREILPSAGDRHREGRHVTILGFDTGHRVVYKPRAIAVDIAYQQLLTWLAHGLGDRTMAMPAHLVRDTHGWSAYIEQERCVSRDDVALFYQRLGMQLALLYALDATDMHLENLIASGSTPVLVDLEALFHPRVGANTESAASPEEASTGAWGPYYESVMRVGLLPSWSYPNADGDAIELSGVGGMADQLLPDEQPVFSEIGQDTMHIARARVKMPAAKNQPQMAGVSIEPAEFTEQLVQGFETAYRYITEHREWLLRSNGLLAAFKDVHVRAVLRHTKVYATLLRDSFHPDLLRDAADRDIHFEALWRVLEARPWYSRIVRHELEDLWRGDVPHFTTRPGSTSLWTSDGQEIPAFFAESAYVNVERRIASLNPTDCERQSWFIRASLATLDVETHTAPARAEVDTTAPRIIDNDGVRRSVSANLPSQSTVVDRSRDLRSRAHRYARRMADRLVSLAIEQGADVNWLGVSLLREKHWSLQPLGDDLYNGRLGVALFLLEVDRTLGHPRAGALARAVLDSCARRYTGMLEHEMAAPTDRAPSSSFMGGAFHALSGGAFVLAHAAEVLQEPRYARMTTGLLQRAADNIAQDDQLDVIAGVAGFVLVGTALFRRTIQAAHATLSQNLQVACDHLIANAAPQRSGIGWNTRIDATQPLTGFSHGASGMALALYQAGRLLGRPDYTASAEQAMSYERDGREQAGEYWPDYRTIAIRTPEGRPPTMHAWCHGAPGIGLARLRILGSACDERLTGQVRQDLQHALRDTCAHGFTGNHSLCHGMLGNFALLEQARRAGVDHEDSHRHHRIAGWILDSMEQAGALCGIPKGIETPGLMTGLAGIGLGLLQLAGDEVVDVLTLTLPGERA